MTRPPQTFWAIRRASAGFTRTPAMRTSPLTAVSAALETSWCCRGQRAATHLYLRPAQHQSPLKVTEYEQELTMEDIAAVLSDFVSQHQKLVILRHFPYQYESVATHFCEKQP